MVCTISRFVPVANGRPFPAAVVVLVAQSSCVRKERNGSHPGIATRLARRSRTSSTTSMRLHRS